MDPGHGWTRVVVEVRPSDAELVADVLWQFLPAAIEEQDAANFTVLLAGFDDPNRAAAAATAAQALTVRSVQVIPVTDDGLDGWRAWATAEHAEPFLIVPPWLDAPVKAAGEHLLWMDPAHTFGSGSHPTTRLVLGRLPSLITPTTTVLDVGCGSGVLAIGAALLGASRVDGIDVDPASPPVTQANAERNGVGGIVHASTALLSSVTQTGATYDLVLANLLAPVIVELAAELVRIVAPEGTLVVSGLLSDRWEEATGALTGLTVADVVLSDGWAAISLDRRPPTHDGPIS